MAAKWQSIGNGLQARTHETRKFGRRFDRFVRGRYQVEGRRIFISFGWESAWVAGERARMLAEGDTGRRRTFIEYCTMEMSRLRDNAKKGQGPLTLKQDRKLAEDRARAEAEARAKEERQALTFGKYYKNTYVPMAKMSKNKNTYRREESIFENWLKPNIGRLRLIDIRPIHIEKISRDMIRKGRAPRTIQLVLATARQVWNHARNNGIVAGDWPGRSVRVGRFDNRRLRFLSRSESDKLLARLQETSQQLHDIALLSLDTGMRAGEIFSLDWENVDLDAGQIKIIDTKSGKNRIAYLTKRVRESLNRLPDRHGLVFPSKKGRQIQQISKSFQRTVDVLGFNKGIVDRRNKVTFHTLRHTFASNLVATGTGLYEVKELLGHSSIALTERYSHVRNENLRAAIRRMESVRAKKSVEVIPMVSPARNIP